MVSLGVVVGAGAGAGVGAGAGAGAGVEGRIGSEPGCGSDIFARLEGSLMMGLGVEGGTGGLYLWVEMASGLIGDKREGHGRSRVVIAKKNKGLNMPAAGGCLPTLLAEIVLYSGT